MNTQPFFTKTAPKRPCCIILFAVPLLLFSTVAPTPALELPANATCVVEAVVDPGSLDGITVEEYEGTLVVKGLAWDGEARWYAGSGEWWDGAWSDYDQERDELCSWEYLEPFMTTGVRVRGVLLTQGTESDYRGNPGILWLQYVFKDAEGVSLGTAEGFVTLKRVECSNGVSSFQGNILDGEADLTFCGTGKAEVPPFILGNEYDEELAAIEEEYLERKANLEEEYAAWLLELEAWHERALAEADEVCAIEPDECEALQAEIEREYDERLAELEEELAEASAEIEEEYSEALAELEEWLLEQRFVQVMGHTVLTAGKPGFDFETAERLPQLKTMFLKERRELKRERAERRAVIEGR